uniref:Uncharacterized protein n=1 Tax=Glossina morsitans morsitans TaxID=37546 RepID=A0A1B0G108_GLOMM
MAGSLTVCTLGHSLGYHFSTIGPYDRKNGNSGNLVNAQRSSSTAIWQHYLGIYEQNVTRKCDDKQFQCGNGACIPIRYLCDGESDCPDHSDEMIETCKFRELIEVSSDFMLCSHIQKKKKQKKSDEEGKRKVF